MKLVVGLGNPDKKYQNTRHNIGFIVLEKYLNNKSKWKKGFHGFYSSINRNGEKIILLKPETYMNNSGNAVFSCSNYYNIAPDDILIIHDDLDLPFLTPRLKYNSSSGGHNGVKSIIKELNSTNINRLKIGIGKAKEDAAEYVLDNFSKNELEAIEESLPKFCEIIDYYLDKGIDKAMNKYN